jgi:clathrin heavy chain
VIEGHAATFADFTVPGATKPSTIVVFATRGPAGSKLFISEMGKTDAGPSFTKRVVDIYYPPDSEADFPVAMQVGEKYGVIYMITKFGYVHLFDLETGTTLYMNRISTETIFVTTPHHATHGILGVNRRGQVLSVSVEPANIVRYITNTLKNVPLAISMASRANLPGADDLFRRQFDQFFTQVCGAVLPSLSWSLIQFVSVFPVCVCVLCVLWVSLHFVGFLCFSPVLRLVLLVFCTSPVLCLFFV